ncbi:MAG: RNA polymerase sigma factor [Candidatus Methylomirabilia bacterium]
MTETIRQDQRLVEALQRGEESAVEEFVDRYGSRIHRVARRLLADEGEAEEVTQDVLLTVVRKIQTFKGEAAFSSWIYRISVNAAYQRLRSRRARAEVSLESFLPVFDQEGRHAHPVADWSSQLEDPAVTAEVRAAIEQSFRRLPEEYRIATLLHDVEGLPNQEVAAALGLTVAAVKSRVHRARLFLRQELAHLFKPARCPARRKRSGASPLG